MQLCYGKRRDQRDPDGEGREQRAETAEEGLLGEKERPINPTDDRLRGGRLQKMYREEGSNQSL